MHITAYHSVSTCRRQQVAQHLIRAPRKWLPLRSCLLVVIGEEVEEGVLVGGLGRGRGEGTRPTNYPALVSQNDKANLRCARQIH